jgi:hypothetical protein
MTPFPEDLRGLSGRHVALELTPAGGGGTVIGRIVGTLDAADGLVVIVEPDDRPGRVSLKYQHVSKVRLDPA